MSNISTTQRINPGTQTGPCVVRSLVKLFNIEDSYFMNDMAKVEKLIAELKTVEVPSKVAPTKSSMKGLLLEHWELGAGAKILSKQISFLSKQIPSLSKQSLD